MPAISLKPFSTAKQCTCTLQDTPTSVLIGQTLPQRGPRFRICHASDLPLSLDAKTRIEPPKNCRLHCIYTHRVIRTSTPTPTLRESIRTDKPASTYLLGTMLSLRRVREVVTRYVLCVTRGWDQESDLVWTLVSSVCDLCSMSAVRTCSRPLSQRCSTPPTLSANAQPSMLCRPRMSPPRPGLTSRD